MSLQHSPRAHAYSLLEIMVMVGLKALTRHIRLHMLCWDRQSLHRMHEVSIYVSCFNACTSSRGVNTDPIAWPSGD